MTNKLIKNEQWYVKTLISKIKNKEIFKPKFQRKRKWDTIPKKDNIPSEKKFILFLFKTGNTVHPITFGLLNNLSNIDGNNRINAIHHFLEEPFSMFDEYLDDINKYIDNNFKDNEKSVIKEIIRKMSYNSLMVFKYKDYFNEIGFSELYNQSLKFKRDEMETYFDALITKLKINGVDRFDTTVLINVNLFEGYTTEELCEVFTDINKYNGGLTEIEALASRLYNITNFTVEDTVLRVEIIECIKKFYLNRTNNEVLDCYRYNENIDEMNAYDFMVGFQNYAHSRCSLIHETDNDGLSLFFKLYKTMNRGSFDDNFNTENVSEFIKYIKKAIDILTKLCKTVFMENLVSGNKIFDACNKKLNSLKKNNIYLIISAIIGYIKNDTDENVILRSIEKCLFFHFFLNEMADKEKQKRLRLNDSILYEAGGAYIDSKSKEFYKNPSLISDKITKDIMIEVINELISENLNNKIYEVRTNGKDKTDKRRQRKLYEKALLYIYYTNKVPTEFLKNIFWVEHIFPFSSSWDGDIDIDRLGNIIPLIDGLNMIRNNRSISEYNNHSKSKIVKYIDIIPTIENYDRIVSHDDKKPHIRNDEKYNQFCENNETALKNVFIEHIFKTDR
jgi:hypothetical protein